MKFYHVTTQANVEAILREGLLPATKARKTFSAGDEQVEGRVYLARDLKNVLTDIFYGEIGNPASRFQAWVVLAVRLPDAWPIEVGEDADLFTRRAIPATVIRQAGVVDLTPGMSLRDFLRRGERIS